MKILSLKALNINSLKGKTEIDFSSLTKNSALFAITGPTGSGKSTLLDIISCALYGRTARLKNPNDLMSRHCGEAYCEVEFEIKGEIYRSSWSQKRARKKHDGNFQTAKMELIDLKENKILPLKSRDVPKKVETLSGLDFGRFTRSMLLAQGGFDAFLKADEKERSALLENITGTQIYAEISMAIFEKHRALAHEMELEQKLLDSIELLDEELLKEKELVLADTIIQKQNSEETVEKLTLYSQLQSTIQTEKSRSLDLENELKILDEEIQVQQKRYEKLKKEFEDLLVIFEEETQKLKKSREIQTQEKQIQMSVFKLESLVKSKEQEREKIRTNLKNLSKLYDETAQKIQEKKNYLLSHSKDEQLLFKLGIIEQNIKLYKEEKESLQRSQSDLLSSSKILMSLTQRKKPLLKEVAKLSLEFQEKESNYKQLEQETFGEFELQEQLQKDLETTQLLQRELKSYRAFVVKKEHEEKELVKYGELYSSLTQTREVSKEHIVEIKKHIETLRDKKAKEQLLKKYEADRKNLLDGEACFLCGSLEHPYAKELPEIAVDETQKMIISQIKELEEKEDKLKALEAHISVTQTKQESAQLELQKLDKELQNLLALFKSYSFALTDESEVTLQERDAQLTKQLHKIKTDRLKKDELLREKDALGKLLKTQESLLGSMDVDMQKHTLNKERLTLDVDLHKSKSETYAKELAQLFEEFGTTVDLQGFEIHFKELLLRKEVYEKTLYDLKTLEHTLNRYEVDKKGAETKFGALDAELQRDLQSIDELKQNGDLLSLQRVSILNVADLDVYEQQIKSNYTNVQTKEQQAKTFLNGLKVKKEERLSNQKSVAISIQKDEKRLELLTIELQESVPFSKDVPKELETLQALLKQKLNALQESIGSMKKELELNQENSTKHKEKIIALQKKKESFKVWVKLNELVGSSDGGKFKKFAQGITLDQLINLANQHLSLLSSRYTLARNQEKLLDLEVIDAYQGDVIRSVNTLSGGESFIVSLALALGLSELASQKISIDSLFLDEGFGTLDEESLETALNALNLLQSGGKMVGVISHVEALKERIPLQIKVVPRGDGTSYVEIE